MRSRLARRLAALLTLALLGSLARAVEVRFEPVAPDVYAFIGEIGGRSATNEGLNANLGLVVTPDGAVLIDSGATWQGARQIHEAIKRVTAQPVRWVVNTGGQDHRWLGNGYFASLGAVVFAHATAEADMRKRGNDQLTALRTLLGNKAEGTIPMLPTRWLAGNDEHARWGGVEIEFKHRGGAHTPGDMMVWLPRQRVLFSGDVVYVDRMLSVIEVSRSKPWLDTFAEAERLEPHRIVPGHGRVANLAMARADTRDYLVSLRAHMKDAVDRGQDISAAAKSFDSRLYLRLANAADLTPGNASRVYLEIERE
jgi:glyoxylase-like metal-dependent hydrolase (beta-lactamase superfamily II)